MDNSLLLKTYQDAFDKAGDTPEGFIWDSAEQKQLTRYNQLYKIIPNDQFFITALDFGCGAGSLATYLLKYTDVLQFYGIDINEKALEVGRKKYPHYEWLTELPDVKVDYVFVSGTFNYHLDIDREDWQNWVFKTIKKLWSSSKRGLAMNFLTYRPDWKDPTCWYPESPRQIIDLLDAPSCTYVIEDYGIRGQWTLLAHK